MNLAWAVRITCLQRKDPYAKDSEHQGGEVIGTREMAVSRAFPESCGISPRMRRRSG